MNADAVLGKAQSIDTQAGQIDRLIAEVRLAGLVSANPFSHGLHPGALVIAPASVWVSASVQADLTTAKNGIAALMSKLYQEVSDQRTVSGAGNSAYFAVTGPKSPKLGAVEKGRIAGFWESLIGAKGALFVGIADLASGMFGLTSETFKWANRLSWLGKAAKGLSVAGKVFAGLGVVTGVYEIVTGIVEKDGFRVADGVIGAGLGVLGLIAIANPVGLAVVAGVGIAWGIATILSGDVPVTKRVADAAGWVGEKAKDLGKGIADKVKKLWPF
jgi:hypothetical protein